MKLSINNVCLKKVYLNFQNFGVLQKPKAAETGKVMLEKDAGADILAAQHKALLLKEIPNFVEPLQTEFKSTKDMFAYAKTRCLKGLKQNYEHVVVMDTKQNKVLVELKGDRDRCDMKILDKMKLDKKYIAIMHGHPENYPLSYKDIRVLKDYDINQMIAINEDGEFSLAYKNISSMVKKEKGLKGWYLARKENQKIKTAFYDFNANTSEDYEIYRNGSEKLYKLIIHGTLTDHLPRMNMRYKTNYKNSKSI